LSVVAHEDALRERTLSMGLCGCCSSAEGEVFKPRNKRWCTDVLCLIFLVVASGAMLGIGYICVMAHPGLIYGLFYPTDSYGNYCGRPGTKTSSMPKVFYPDLDNDIFTHADKLASQQYLTFLDSVTRICAPSAHRRPTAVPPTPTMGRRHRPLPTSTEHRRSLAAASL